MRNYFLFSSLLLALSFSASVQAQRESISAQQAEPFSAERYFRPKKAVISDLDLEAQTIQLNQQTYVLSKNLVISTPQQSLAGLQYLNKGQLIEFKIKDHDPSQTYAQAQYPMVQQIRILTNIGHIQRD
jgi:hypothetical protein